MASTVNTLLQRIQTKLSMLGGIDVQTYGQPKLVELIQAIFNDVFDQEFWYDHILTKSYTLDGVTGLITTDLSNDIKRFSDIKHIFIPSQQSPLAQGPMNINPAMINQICFLPYGDPTKRFQIYPLTTTGALTVRYRTKPAAFKQTDTVPFDDEYMVFEACAEYLMFEGANTAVAKDMRDKADARLMHLKELHMKNERSLYGAGLATQDQWRDA